MATELRDLDPNKNFVWDNDKKDWVEDTSIQSSKEKWYTTKDAAKTFGVPITTIKSAIITKRLKATEIAGRSPTGYIYYIRESDIKEWMSGDTKTYHGHMKPEDRDAAAMEHLKTISDEKWYNTTEAAKELGVTEAYVRNAAHNNILDVEKVELGSREYFYFSETALIKFMTREKKKMGRPKKSEQMKNMNTDTEPKLANAERGRYQLERSNDEALRDAITSAMEELIARAVEERMSAEIDKAYQRGLAEGRAKAKEEMIAVIKEVG